MSLAKKKNAIPCVTGNHQMSWRELAEADDLASALTVDPYLGFTTHKMTDMRLKIPERIQKKFCDIISTFRKNKCYDTAFNQLTADPNIVKRSWSIDPRFKEHINRYLLLFDDRSGIEIRPCWRYASENHMGAAIYATKDWPKGSRISTLVGCIAELKHHEEATFLKQHQNDFSVMYSSRKNCSQLWLGPAAYVNHDCRPNCEFTTNCDADARMSLEAITDIKCGDEIFIYYGTNFFDTNNAACECFTCELLGRGYFSKFNQSVDMTNPTNELSPSNTISDQRIHPKNIKSAFHSGLNISTDHNQILRDRINSVPNNSRFVNWVGSQVTKSISLDFFLKKGSSTGLACRALPNAYSLRHTGYRLNRVKARLIAATIASVNKSRYSISHENRTPRIISPYKKCMLRKTIKKTVSSCLQNESNLHSCDSERRKLNNSLSVVKRRRQLLRNSHLSEQRSFTSKSTIKVPVSNDPTVCDRVTWQESDGTSSGLGYSVHNDCSSASNSPLPPLLDRMPSTSPNNSFSDSTVTPALGTPYYSDSVTQMSSNDNDDDMDNVSDANNDNDAGTTVTPDLGSPYYTDSVTQMSRNDDDDDDDDMDSNSNDINDDNIYNPIDDNNNKRYTTVTPHLVSPYCIDPIIQMCCNDNDADMDNNNDNSNDSRGNNDDSHSDTDDETDTTVTPALGSPYYIDSVTQMCSIDNGDDIDDSNNNNNNNNNDPNKVKKDMTVTPDLGSPYYIDPVIQMYSNYNDGDMDNYSNDNNSNDNNENNNERNTTVTPDLVSPYYIDPVIQMYSNRNDDDMDNYSNDNNYNDSDHRNNKIDTAIPPVRVSPYYINPVTQMHTNGDDDDGDDDDDSSDNSNSSDSDYNDSDNNKTETSVTPDLGSPYYIDSVTQMCGIDNDDDIDDNNNDNINNKDRNDDHNERDMSVTPHLGSVYCTNSVIQMYSNHNDDNNANDNSNKTVTTVTHDLESPYYIRSVTQMCNSDNNDMDNNSKDNSNYNDKNRSDNKRDVTVVHESPYYIDSVTQMCSIDTSDDSDNSNNNNNSTNGNSGSKGTVTPNLGPAYYIHPITQMYTNDNDDNINNKNHNNVDNDDSNVNDHNKKTVKSNLESLDCVHLLTQMCSIDINDDNDNDADIDNNNNENTKKTMTPDLGENYNIHPVTRMYTSDNNENDIVINNNTNPISNQNDDSTVIKNSRKTVTSDLGSPYYIHPATQMSCNDNDSNIGNDNSKKTVTSVHGSPGFIPPLTEMCSNDNDANNVNNHNKKTVTPDLGSSDCIHLLTQMCSIDINDDNDNDADIDNNNNENSTKTVTPDRGSTHSIHPVTQTYKNDNDDNSGNDNSKKTVTPHHGSPDRIPPLTEMYSIDDGGDDIDNNVNDDNNCNDNSKKTVTPHHRSPDRIPPLTKMYSIDDDDDDDDTDNSVNDKSKKTVTPDPGSSYYIHPVTQMCNSDHDDMHNYNKDNNSCNDNNRSDNDNKSEVTVTLGHRSPFSIDPVTRIFSNGSEDYLNNTVSGDNDNSKKTVTPDLGSPYRMFRATQMSCIYNDDDNNNNNDNNNRGTSVTPEHKSACNINSVTQKCINDIDDDMDNNTNDKKICIYKDIKADNDKNVNNNSNDNNDINIKKDDDNNDIYNDNNFIDDNDGNCNNDKNDNIYDNDSEINMNNNAVLSRSSEMCNQLSTDKLMSSLVTLLQATEENKTQKGVESILGRLMHESQCDINKSLVNNHLPSQSSTLRGKRRITNYDARLIAEAKLLGPMTRRRERKPLSNPDYLEFISLKDVVGPPKLTSPKSNGKRKTVNKPSQFSIDQNDDCKSLDLKDTDNICCPKSTLFGSTENQYTKVESTSNDLAPPLLLSEHPCVDSELTPPDIVAEPVTKCDPDSVVAPDPVPDTKTTPEKCQPKPHYFFRKTKCNYRLRRVVHIASPPLLQAVPPPTAPDIVAEPVTKCDPDSVVAPDPVPDTKTTPEKCQPRPHYFFRKTKCNYRLRRVVHMASPPLLQAVPPPTAPDIVAEPVTKCDPESVVAPDPVPDTKTTPEKCQPRPHYFFRKTKCNYRLRRVVHIASPPLLQAVPPPTAPDIVAEPVTKCDPDSVVAPDPVPDTKTTPEKCQPRPHYFFRKTKCNYRLRRVVHIASPPLLQAVPPPTAPDIVAEPVTKCDPDSVVAPDPVPDTKTTPEKCQPRPHYFFRKTKCNYRLRRVVHIASPPLLQAVPSPIAPDIVAEPVTKCDPESVAAPDPVPDTKTTPEKCQPRPHYFFRKTKCNYRLRRVVHIASPPLLQAVPPPTAPDIVAEPVTKCDPDSVVAPDPVPDTKTTPEKCQPRPHYFFRKTKCNYRLRRVVYIPTPPLLQAVPSPIAPDIVAEPVTRCDPESVVAPDPVPDTKTTPEKCQPRPHYFFRMTKCNYRLRRVVYIPTPPLLQSVTPFDLYTRYSPCRSKNDYLSNTAGKAPIISRAHNPRRSRNSNANGVISHPTVSNSNTHRLTVTLKRIGPKLYQISQPNRIFIT
ncbi:unnamed protein product [Trichobilharzia szidati]|nr:unnamed protein product [Trichobilharzia szidati]